MAPDRRREAAGRVACLAAAAMFAIPGAVHAQSALSGAGDGESISIISPSGASPTVLPQIGSAVPSSISLQPSFAPGDLNDQLRSLALGTPVAGPQQAGWSFVPSIGLTQEYDTGSGGGDGGGGFVTSITPSIAINGTTTRLQTEIYYAPVVRIYDGGGGGGGDQDRFSQNLNAHALATVVPQTVFLDLRGSASEQSRFGGLGPSETTTLNSNDATQNYSFTAAPYVLHRFGDIGTGEIGYAFGRTLQDSATLDSTDTGGAALANALNDTGTGNVTTQNAHIAFTTGQAFGRYNAAALASGSKYDGSGVLQGAYRNVVSVDNGYAVTRTITALARIGYEDIHYSGSEPIGIHDVLWDAGVRLAPTATSSITARYGHHDGLNALSFSGNIAPTALTRLYAEYSAGLSTQLEDLQNALTSTDIDALGAPVDHATGIPIFMSDGFFGTQSGLYRLHRFSAGGELVLDRDVISVSVNRDQRKLVSGPNAEVVELGAVASSTGTTGSVSWSHELSASFSAVAYFQYGVTSGGALIAAPGQNDTTVVASLSANYRLGETVTLTALYSYTKDSGGGSPIQANDTGQNRFLVGVSKSF